MLKEERQQLILNLLQKDGRLVASELSQQLNVSEDTIRRDLRQLTEAGKLQRVHGGALPGLQALPHSPAELDYAQRMQQSPQAKAQLAQTTLSYLQDGMVVFFDGGTSTYQVAQQLPRNLHITVVTISLPIANALIDHPSAEIIMLNGRIDKSSRTVNSISTLETVRTIYADVCLLGVCSVHPENGISSVEFDESMIKRAMLERSALRIAPVTPEKLDTASPYLIGPLSLLDLLITSREVDPQVLEPYRQKGLDVELC